MSKDPARLSETSGAAACDAMDDSLAVAKRIYDFRRRRGTILASDLFGEPAWDLLLDLFIAEKEGRRSGVASACEAAIVPGATGLRWIRELEARGLVRRESDPRGGEIHVRLSAGALRELERLFTEWRRLHA